MAVENKPNILYVDDDVNCLDAFKALYRRHYQIYTALSADRAKIVIAENDIHVLLTDQRMPEVTGTTLLEYAVNNYPKLVRILISGYGDDVAVMLSMHKGHIVDFVSKPWNVDDLKKQIDFAYDVYCRNIEEERKSTEAEEANKRDDREIGNLFE